MPIVERLSTIDRFGVSLEKRYKKILPSMSDFEPGHSPFSGSVGKRHFTTRNENMDIVVGESEHWPEGLTDGLTHLLPCALSRGHLHRRHNPIRGRKDQKSKRSSANSKPDKGLRLGGKSNGQKQSPKIHPRRPQTVWGTEGFVSRVPSGYKWRETKKARQIKRETQEAGHGQ